LGVYDPQISLRNESQNQEIISENESKKSVKTVNVI
jgi:hypothetical protein